MKIPTDLKDVAAIRDCLNTVRTQVCALADYLTEPWKTHFNSLKDQYDTALATLSPTDQVPAALEAGKQLQAFWSCLMSANSLASMLGTAMNGMKQAEATALNSGISAAIALKISSGELIAKETIPILVEKELTAKTAAGDLVPKEMHAQLCAAARTTGLGEGETKVRAEVQAKEVRVQRAEARKTLLQTAGLPIPEAAMMAALEGTDEEFAAAQKVAEGRIASLQQKGVALNSKTHPQLLAKVWLPVEQWNVFEPLMVEAVKGGNPLAAPGGPATGPMGPMIC